MMDWQTISAVGAVASVCGALFAWFWRKGLPAIRKINHFVDDMTGESARPGFDARPGLFQRLDSIEHELHPNSGKSLRDAIDQQGKKLDDHIAACPPSTTTININPEATP